MSPIGFHFEILNRNLKHCETIINDLNVKSLNIVY